MRIIKIIMLMVIFVLTECSKEEDIKVSNPQQISRGSIIPMEENFHEKLFPIGESVFIPKMKTTTETKAEGIIIKRVGNSFNKTLLADIIVLKHKRNNSVEKTEFNNQTIFITTYNGIIFYQMPSAILSKHQFKTHFNFPLSDILYLVSDIKHSGQFSWSTTKSWNKDNISSKIHPFFLKGEFIDRNVNNPSMAHSDNVNFLKFQNLFEINKGFTANMRITNMTVKTKDGVLFEISDESINNLGAYQEAFGIKLAKKADIITPVMVQYFELFDNKNIKALQFVEMDDNDFIFGSDENQTHELLFDIKSSYLLLSGSKSAQLHWIDSLENYKTPSQSDFLTLELNEEVQENN
ncbi:MAG: hypothetical protein ACRCTJ_01155 [Brevinema sp.]